MPKNVKLILEQDWGIYSDEEIEEMGGLSKDPKYWEEGFYQSDIYPCEMKIVDVVIEDVEETE